jgi:hypothetical protein
MSTDEPNIAPKYNVPMLHAFEYFLSRDKDQTNLIQNLIKDYQPKITITKAAGVDQQVSRPGSISCSIGISKFLLSVTSPI